MPDAVEDSHGVAPCNACKRDVELTSPLKGTGGRRRDGYQSARAERGHLFNEFEGAAARDDGKPLPWLRVCEKQGTDEFVEGVVTADIFPHGYNLAVETCPGGSMDSSGLGIQWLTLLHLCNGALNRGNFDAGRLSHRGLRMGQRRQIVNATQTASCSS
jgi:hypothetical protein